MIDSILWWSGIIPWGVIAYFVFVIAWEILGGFAAAVDWFVWTHRRCKLNGRRFRWLALPRAFFPIWFDLIGASNSSTTYSAIDGEWRGFRDWDVQKIKNETVSSDIPLL
jgi:hypothetical protein